jgi:hypothetical protein
VRSACLAFAEVDPFEELQQNVVAVVQGWLEQFRPMVERGEQPTIQQLSALFMKTRGELLGGCMKAVIEELYRPFFNETTTACPLCDRILTRKRIDAKECSTMQGEFGLGRPYFHCPPCGWGGHPVDVALGLARERHQYDVQEHVIRLGADLPYEPTAEHFERLSGVAVGAHFVHATLNDVAVSATLEEVVPSTEELERRTRDAREHATSPPVMVIAIDGAHTPIRPEGKRAERRGPGEWKETKGVRIYLSTDDDRIVHLASWHRTSDKKQFAWDLTRIARRLPKTDLPTVAVGDGAPWIWKLVSKLFPGARQVLDYYHCAEHIHAVAKVQYEDQEKATEWTEATFARLHLGRIGPVIAGLKRMHPRTTEAQQETSKLIAYLEKNRLRLIYSDCDAQRLPKGSGAIESANKFIHHVRLKRSGAWWLKPRANLMLAIRCAIYNATFDRVFARHVRFEQRLLGYC